MYPVSLFTNISFIAFVIMMQYSAAQSFVPAQSNPFGLNDVGGLSSPVFGDLDNDGDFDFMTGSTAGTFKYFENTGTATIPVFAIGQTNPFGLSGIGSESKPTFVDLDNDGDLDLVSGEQNFNLYYFENIGSLSAPNYASAQTNPFNFVPCCSGSKHNFDDFDNDGDFDLLLGHNGGDFFYFQNIGNASSPVYDAAQSNPFGLTIPVGGSPAHPCIGDLDNDGDFDILAGEFFGDFQYYQNSGSISSPIFSVEQNNPFGLSNIGLSSNPTFVDIDNDGDLDVMSGSNDGNFFYFENSSVNSITENETFLSKIYPNPTNNEFTLDFKIAANYTSIIFTTLEGKIVYQYNDFDNEQLVIDASNWSCGVYIGTISLNNQNQNFKLIKQ